MKKVVAIVISILIILGIMVVGLISLFNDKQKISGDSLKFKEEYEILNGKYYEEGNIITSNLEIKKDNPFIYVNDFDILEKLTKGTHIIYFGNPECGWSRRVVPVLTSFAERNSIETIYYYNFSNLEKLVLDENKDKIKLYNNILNIIKDYNKDETLDTILTPVIFFIKDGSIIGSHYKLVENYMNYNVELSDEQIEELMDIYQVHYDNIISQACEEDC